jgi:hypothetical protein
VDDSGNVTEDCEEDVDQQIAAAAALEEDTQGREDDGNDDLADIAGDELVTAPSCPKVIPAHLSRVVVAQRTTWRRLRARRKTTELVFGRVGELTWR